MSEVGSFEAKTHLPRLLDRVAGGETFIITKHGRPVARLVPVDPSPHADVARTVQELEALQQELRLNAPGTERLTVRELIDDGRKW